MKRSRPLVPNPCHEDWDKLTPEERGHFCTVCQTKVWDLSSLTKEEAEEFLRETEGDLCVSYEEKGGEVVHREAPVVPLGRLVRRLPAAAGFSLALAACTPSGQDAKPADGGNEAQTEPAQPKPEPEEVNPEEPKPDEEAPTTAVDAPEPLPEPEEQHVKGKWVRPEDESNEKPVKPDKPMIKKGKVARPD
jgi:hypothetical protein